MTFDELEKGERLLQKIKNIVALLNDAKRENATLSICSPYNSFVLLGEDSKQIEQWLQAKKSSLEKEFAEL